jgi:hypothetical protein
MQKQYLQKQPTQHLSPSHFCLKASGLLLALGGAGASDWFNPTMFFNFPQPAKDVNRKTNIIYTDIIFFI